VRSEKVDFICEVASGVTGAPTPGHTVKVCMSTKPPRRYWKAAESFFDLKLSHWIQIILTVGLIGVAFLQALIYRGQAKIMATQSTILNDQAKDTHAALVAANRAWVGSLIGSVSGVPTTVGADTTAYANVSLTNTGREPAINAGIDLFIDTVDVNASVEAMHQKQNSYAIECKAQKINSQLIVINPSVDPNHPYTTGKKIPPETIDWAVIYGRKYLLFHGCINYDTFNTTRHTAFCYFFQAGESNPAALPLCDQGGYAD
jgi:hypothetical protein